MPDPISNPAVNPAAKAIVPDGLKGEWKDEATGLVNPVAKTIVPDGPPEAAKISGEPLAAKVAPAAAQPQPPKPKPTPQPDRGPSVTHKFIRRARGTVPDVTAKIAASAELTEKEKAFVIDLITQKNFAYASVDVHIQTTARLHNMTLTIVDAS